MPFPALYEHLNTGLGGEPGCVAFVRAHAANFRRTLLRRAKLKNPRFLDGLLAAVTVSLHQVCLVFNTIHQYISCGESSVWRELHRTVELLHQWSHK